MKTGLIILLWLQAALASAQQIVVQIELPELAVPEYHRPYLAVWISDAQRKPVQQLALWLEQEKWHRDLRQWWRRGGRNIALPIDGVSGATRKPGRYTLNKSLSLQPGQYALNIEAVREVGGRELLQLPFNWQGQRLDIEGVGERELGAVSATIKTEEAQ